MIPEALRVPVPDSPPRHFRPSAYQKRPPRHRPRIALALVLMAAVVYGLEVRPWMRSWGATPEELQKPLPGDELVTTPQYQATHAISIASPPERVWPWLAQLGCNRAGWYSYDWLDNGGKPSADRILPQFQTLRVGQAIPATPDGSFTFPVAAFEPGKYLVLGGTMDGETGRSIKPGEPRPANFFTGAWAMVLEPEAADRTRLVIRFRAEAPAGWQGAAMTAAMEPIHFLMERKMMLNLKARAEASRPE